MGRDNIIQALESLTVLELVGLYKELRERWGVREPYMPTPVLGPEIEPKPVLEEEEQVVFTVILKEIGPNKINVIKAVREFTTLGLREAKSLVDTAPQVVKEGMNKYEVAEIKAKLEATGATVEIV